MVRPRRSGDQGLSLFTTHRTREQLARRAEVPLGSRLSAGSRPSVPCGVDIVALWSSEDVGAARRRLARECEGAGRRSHVESTGASRRAFEDKPPCPLWQIQEAGGLVGPGPILDRRYRRQPCERVRRDGDPSRARARCMRTLRAPRLGPSELDLAVGNEPVHGFLFCLATRTRGARETEEREADRREAALQRVTPCACGEVSTASIVFSVAFFDSGAQSMRSAARTAISTHRPIETTRTTGIGTQRRRPRPAATAKVALTMSASAAPRNTGKGR